MLADGGVGMLFRGEIGGKAEGPCRCLLDWGWSRWEVVRVIGKVGGDETSGGASMLELCRAVGMGELAAFPVQDALSHGIPPTVSPSFATASMCPLSTTKYPNQCLEFPVYCRSIGTRRKKKRKMGNDIRLNPTPEAHQRKKLGKKKKKKTPEEKEPDF